MSVLVGTPRQDRLTVQNEPALSVRVVDLDWLMIHGIHNVSLVSSAGAVYTVDISPGWFAAGCDMFSVPGVSINRFILIAQT